ncbi:hypothetical protein [Croceimicrobium sp.]|uniref:hypothetical protein n=1 Tax=Croceimicrobium sp. TaxID=2828340 RepID=UPI003BA9C02B
MKNLRLTVGLLMLVLISSCHKNKDPLLNLAILHDQTETMSQVTYSDLRKLLIYDDPRLLWYEVSVKTRGLSDIPHGVVEQSVLPEANSNQVTELRRKSQFREFLGNVQRMMTDATPSGNQRNASHLYVGIAEELVNLSTKKATNRIAVISSDLHENTDWFSVYRSEDRKLLLHCPDSVARRFEKTVPLGDLTGVKVYFVHLARPETQEVFEAMSKLYTNMLEAKGAKVYTASKLVFTQSIEP